MNTFIESNNYLTKFIMKHLTKVKHILELTTSEKEQLINVLEIAGNMELHFTKGFIHDLIKLLKNPTPKHPA